MTDRSSLTSTLVPPLSLDRRQFDIVIYPGLRRLGINFSPIKRITCGFFTGALAMLCAALVQNAIYHQSACGYQAATCDTVVDINVWTQAPSYCLIAVSEIFASVTGLEYAFTLAPKSMRSLVMSVFLFQSALASAVGEAFVPLSNDPNLIWLYGTMGTLATLAGIAFWFCRSSSATPLAPPS